MMELKLILIHVGLDTVKLEGKPFNLFVTEGQKVKQGDKLMEIDFAMVEEQQDVQLRHH